MRILMIIHHLKGGGPVKQAQLMEIYFVKAGNKVDLYGISKSKGLFHSVRDFSKTYRELKKEIKKERYDLIQVYDPFFAGLIGIRLKLRFRIPVILRIGTVIEDFYMSRVFEKLKLPYNKFLFSLPKFPLYIFTRILLTFYNCIVFNSQFLLTKYAKNSNKKKRVILNGVDLELFSKAKDRELSREIIKLLYVGRIEPKKAINDLISVSYKLKEKKVKHHLEIIGNIHNKSKYFQAIKNEIEEKNLQDEISICSSLSHQELAEKYYQSTFLLFITNSKKFPITDGTPNVIIEAMAMGLLVIATNVAGVPELIENEINGFLVEEGNFEQMSSIIINFKEKHYNLKEISKTNINKIEKYFSIDVCSENYLNLYREFIKAI